MEWQFLLFAVEMHHFLKEPGQMTLHSPPPFGTSAREWGCRMLWVEWCPLSPTQPPCKLIHRSFNTQYLTECDLIWRLGPYTDNQVKMKSLG